MTYYIVSDWASDKRVLSGNEVETELEAKAIVSRLTGIAMSDADISLVKQRLDANNTSDEEKVHFNNLLYQVLDASKHKADVFYTDTIICPETHKKHCSSFIYWVADPIEKTCTMNHALLDENINRLAKTKYQRDRQPEYPPATDYLDGIVKGDQAQIDKYIADCLAVKDKYPK
jgi:hypothetical protein